MSFSSFLSLFRQDLAIIFRNGYIYVVLGMAFLFISLINFAIPSQLNFKQKEIFIVDHTTEQLIEPKINYLEFKVNILKSENELIEILDNDKFAYGIVFKGDISNPQSSIYHQSSENEKYLINLKAISNGLWSIADDQKKPMESKQLLLGVPKEKEPFNLMLVPFLLALEVTLMGGYFVAGLVFQEKVEGSIRAYRISPGGTWPYIMSKTLVNVLLALLYGVLLLVFTFGFIPELLQVMLLVGLGSFIITAVGLIVSVYFESLSECLFVLVFMAAIVVLPLISYFIPSFKIIALQIIPTYPLVFGIRELLFTTGTHENYIRILALLIGETIFMMILTRYIVGKKLMGEVRK